MDKPLESYFNSNNDFEIHRFNKCLPDYASGACTNEATALADEISSGFMKWKTSQDQGERGNVAVLMRSARLLQTFLDLKYVLQDETKVTFLEQMRDIAFADKAPLSVQVKMFQMMEKLLKKRVVMLNYEVSWKTSYDLLWFHHLRPSAQPPVCSVQNESSHRRALVSLIYQQRHYHGMEVAKEIWEEQSPILRELGQLNCTRALALLTIFMPSKHTLYSELLPEWMRLWASVDHCPEWDTCWLILFCRARKHTAPSEWARHLPQIFAQASYALRLPIGKGEKIKTWKFPNVFKVLLDEALGGNPSVCQMRKLAKLVTFAMGHGETEEVDLPTGDQGALETYSVSRGTRLLIQLINSTRTFVHPSNHGAWSTNLATFFGWICAELCRRVGTQWGVPSEDGRGGLQGGYLPVSKVEVRAVIKTVLPLVQQMLYSKVPSIGEVAQRCLKHLCCLSPYEMSHAIVQSLGGALDPSAVNQTHQLVPALQTLGLLIRPLMYPRPLIAPYLPSILELSLPGLDANDVKKTMVTLGFYHNILNWIPIVSEDNLTADGMEAKPNSLPPLCYLDNGLPDDQRGGQFCGSEEDLYDSSRRLTKYLGGWCLQVLERLFKLVENLEAPSKPTGDGGILDKLAGHQQMAMMFTLSRCVESMFQQMDEDVHAQATQILLGFITDKCLPDAVKKVALIVEACVGSRNSALQTILPNLMEGVPGYSQEASVELSSREITWRIRLLTAGLKSAGDAILPFADSLMKIMEACAVHEDKKVKKVGRKLLRHTLRALVDYYPLDYRSSADPSNSQIYGVPLTCNTDLNLIWHELSEAGMAVVVRLFDVFVGGAMRALEEDMAGKGELKGRERAELWRSKLKIILYALRGGSPVLQDGNGEEVLVNVGFEGFRVLPGLRQQIGAFLHRASDFLTSDPGFDGDVKTLKALIEPMEWVLSKRAANAHQAKMGIYFLKQTKARHCDQVYNGRKKALVQAGAAKGLKAPIKSCVPLGGSCRPRAYLVERVYYQHLTRQREGALAIPHKLKGGPLATVYEELMRDLIDLSTKSVYAETRKKAQSTFDTASNFFTWVPKDCTAELVATLSEEGTSHEEGTGIVHLLSQKRWMRHLSGRWDQTQHFLCSMCESQTMVAALPKDRQPKMTTRLQNLFIKYLNGWQLVGLYTDTEKEEYVSLMRSLAAMVNPTGIEGGNGPRLHWRYEMMVTWALISLQRKDIPPPPEVLQWLLKALGRDNGQPLQRLGLYGFVRLLVLHPLLLCSEHKALLCQETNLKAFCWALLYNHTRTTETEGTSTEAAKWSVGVMDMLKDAGREGRNIFPHCRINHLSYVFKSQNARAVKALVRCCGEEVVPGLLGCATAVQEEAPDEDKQKAHATVAEVFGGSLRALNKEMTTVSTVHELILPVFQEMADKASPELANDLGDGVLYAVAKRPLPHVRPLLDHIVSQVHLWFGPNEGKELKGAGAGQVKVLIFLIACLAEVVSFGPARNELAPLVAEIVPVLTTRYNLAHPFKIVREHLSMVLYVVGPFLRRLESPEGRMEVSEPTFLTVVKEVLGDSVSMEEVLRVETADPSSDAQTEEVQSAIERGDEQSGKSERARMIETVVGWVYFVTKMGDTLEYLPDLLPLLPSVLEGARDPEPQTQAAAIHALGTLSQAMFIRGTGFSSLASTLVQLSSKLARHSSWYSRRACLEFIGIFQAHHHFNLASEDHALFEKRLVECLADDRKEAQDTAGYALTTRIAFLESQQTISLATKFEEMAGAALKKYKIISKRLKAAKTDEEKEDLNAKLAKNTKKHKKGVLGLASVILASPYDLPTWLPSALTSLANHEGIALGIGETVRKTFTDFKRTHQDSWEMHRLRFTRDQLEIVNSMLISPSYYA